MNKANPLQQLSNQDMMLLGIEDVAYVKATTEKGETLYLIHAADGNVIGRSTDRDVAIAAVRQHGLEPLSVH